MIQSKKIDKYLAGVPKNKQFVTLDKEIRRVVHVYHKEKVSKSFVEFQGDIINDCPNGDDLQRMKK